MSTRDDILAEFAPTVEPVDVPGSGVRVYIRSLDSAGAVAMFGAKNAAESAMLAVTLSVCDEGGERLFTDEDTDRVAALSWRFLDAVSGAVMELNGLGDDAAGKSETTPDGEPPTD